MTPDDLVRELAALDAVLAQRIEFVHIIIDERGNEIGRFRRGRYSPIPVNKETEP